MNMTAPNGVSLNDKERMEDLLSQEKHLITTYSTFIPEAACPNLRNVLTTNFTDCVQNQYQVYDKMNQLGWYPPKPAQQTDVDAARQKFQQMKQQLG